MTPREVSSAHFPNLAATLLADHTVVAFTPATSDFPWAADVTWSAARALARTGRRVALVDLCLGQPVLHRRAQDAIDEGIVDALLFDVSLGHVAREQEPGLHFIGAGTVPPDVEEVYAHERWQRLGRGFKQEGALLLLFAAPSVLPRMRADLDAIVVLCPGGYASDTPTFPGIGERLAAGTPLLAAVRKGRASAQTALPRASGARPSVSTALRRPRRSRGSATMAVALGTVAVAAIAGALLRPWRWAAPPTDAAAEAVTPTPAERPAAATPLPAREPGDSLFYSVQVAAFNQPDQAAAYAARLARVGAATVSPVYLGRQGLWYRVVVGAMPTAAAADSLLRWMWREHLIERPNGTILRTPHASALAESGSPGEAERLAAALRRRGIAAYIVPAPGGSARVLAGAFEAPDQARAADSLLRRAGLKSTLVLRTGTIP